MKRIWIVAGVLATLGTTTSFANDPKRIDAIWKAMKSRIVQQNDVWYNLGDYPRVIQLLRMHYSLDQTDYDIATNLGYMLESTEQNDLALAVYIQLRNSASPDPDKVWPEANFYYQKKAFAKIPPLLEPTLKQNPHSNSYRTLAHAYEKMNMLIDCKRVWESLIAKHPEDGQAKNNLNRVSKKLKEGFSQKT